MDSVETCLRAADGVITVALEAEEITLSEHHACPACELSFPELQPTLFSFNSPVGMCPECNGLGVKLQVDTDLIITNPDLRCWTALRAGTATCARKAPGIFATWKRWLQHYNVDLERPGRTCPSCSGT
jgi:excinuclease ABC subunit A